MALNQDYYAKVQKRLVRHHNWWVAAAARLKASVVSAYFETHTPITLAARQIDEKTRSGKIPLGRPSNTSGWYE